MKIWGQDFNPRVKKVQVTALYTGHELPITEVDESKRKEYLKKVPTGFVPALETPEGFLNQTNAILRYLARNTKSTKLYGNNQFEEALVNQWLDWCLTELEPAALGYSAPYLGFAPYEKEIQAKSGEDLRKFLNVLDGGLKGKTYLVGESISIADISIASALNFALQFLLDEKYRKNIPNVTKWYETITNQENWKKVYGKSVLCITPLKEYTGSFEEVAQEAKGKK